jgi:RNA recognition motif-containing protein
MPSKDSKRNQHGNYGYANGRGGGGAPRNHVIPNEPPFTAYIGNAPDSMVQGDFEMHLFVGLKVKQVRLVRDRQTDRFRGFAYVDFEDADSLRRAIELDGTFVNDRPIRIDVAVRPLGATKPEGFRNKPDFESRDNRRQPPGHGNNRYNDGYHQGGRTGNNYNPQETSENVEGGYNDEYYTERNRRSSGSGKTNERRHSQSQQQHKTPPRKVSNNDDVFIVPDTPNSNEDGTDQTNNDQGGGQTIGRQQSRNWADCPIDESAAEPSPPPSANNTFSGDDFQVVRNKNPKSRTNQQPSSAHSMGNQPGRGRNYRGGVSQMSGSGGGRGYYEQISPQYLNQSQQFYHHQQAPPPLHMGLSYHNNNHNRHQQPAEGGGSRQRLNSNRSNNGRNYNDNNGRSKKGNNDHIDEIPDNSVPAENRPRLQLLPRSQKLSSSTDDNQTPEPVTRNASIFGCGKPRDERDPKLAELNKHIEEVVEKEQHVPRTKSTTSNGSTDGVIKPVRILTAATESLLGH